MFSGSACSLTFQMRLHPRQPWQLWKHPFHGRCQEWTHIRGQDAVRGAPGRARWISTVWNTLETMTDPPLVSIRGISNSQRSTRSSAAAPSRDHWPNGGAEVPGTRSKCWREPESERHPTYSSALCCKGKILHKHWSKMGFVPPDLKQMVDGNVVGMKYTNLVI